jgi:hypothetical protein
MIDTFFVIRARLVALGYVDPAKTFATVLPKDITDLLISFDIDLQLLALDLSLFVHSPFGDERIPVRSCVFDVQRRALYFIGTWNLGELLLGLAYVLEVKDSEIDSASPIPPTQRLSSSLPSPPLR